MTAEEEARAALERAATLLGVSLAEARRRAAIALVRVLEPGWTHHPEADPRQIDLPIDSTA